MAIPETSSKRDALSTSKAEPEPRGKHRRHGYRGYPNGPSAGSDIHWGSGFAGIGSLSGPPGSSGILTERTRNDVARKTKVEDDDTLDG